MGDVAAAALGTLPALPQQLAKAHANYKFVVFSAVRPEPVAEGDEVFVVLRSNKNTGRARALGGVIQDPGHPHYGRIPVLYHDNQATYHVRPGRVNKVVMGDRLVIICGDTENYRHLARCQVAPHHFVLDLGSSYGVSTHILSQHCGRVIGVDLARDLVESARRQYPHIPFECLDILQNPARITELARGCDSVFIDIGGDRQLAQVVPTVEFVKRHLAPATIVVKSRELLKAAVTCIKGHRRKVDAGGGSGANPLVTDASGVNPPVSDASGANPVAVGEAVMDASGSVGDPCVSDASGGGAAPLVTDDSSGAEAGATRLGHGTWLAGFFAGTSAVDVPGDEVWWDQLFAHVTGLGGDPAVAASSAGAVACDSNGIAYDPNAVASSCAVSDSNPAVTASDPTVTGIETTVTAGDLTVTAGEELSRDSTGASQEPQYALPKYDLPKPKYPLYYPTRYASNGVKICRFHNYRTCLKGAECPSVGNGGQGATDLRRPMNAHAAAALTSAGVRKKVQP
eukprot:jgi/Mesvir1/22588/Mv05009-RA.1